MYPKYARKIQIFLYYKKEKLTAGKIFTSFATPAPSIKKGKRRENAILSAKDKKRTATLSAQTAGWRGEALKKGGGV